MNTAPASITAATDAAPQFALLPEALLRFAVRGLPIPEPLASSLCAHGVTGVGDLLALPRAVFEPGGWLGPAGADDLRDALARVLHAGLARCGSAAPGDDPSLQGQLLAALDDEQRSLLRQLLGLGQDPATLLEIARSRGLAIDTVVAAAEAVRLRLHERAPSLLVRMRHEVGRDLQACGGVLTGSHLAPGSLLHALAAGCGDGAAALRLCAFCFPHDLHQSGDLLVGLPARSFRRLERELRRAVQPHRLPLAVDDLVAELATAGLAPPRGLVLHLLRADLRAVVAVDGGRGEMVVPDPRAPAARLQDLLAELGQPTPFEDLVFAWRERYRRANRAALRQCLRGGRAFLRIGPDTWSLRSWHVEELAAATPLADRVARALCQRGGKQRIEALLGEAGADPRSLWLVIDRLAGDPRVRLLGRAEACPATQSQSQVLEQLLADFRRAGGDVVLGRFLQNQPAGRRRLVQRLLRENRLFVTPGANRVDLLANYPFNQDRLRALSDLVARQLATRAGYAPASALKAAVDRADLGGDWLTPGLLADVLARHGRFDVLPGGLVCRRGTGVAAELLRAARQALRAAEVPLTVADIVRARPDLVEFTDCLRELLAGDPLVRAADSDRFALV
ncbi:MAG: hypothetical protein FJ265_05475 [Planctomycetes bacterium]|nr:hypothetical protein [Planctomycetota bacterium]